MLFVQRELKRIQGALTSDKPPERYREHYAAQQALLWVLDPDTFKAPVCTKIPKSDRNGDEVRPGWHVNE